MEPVQPKLQTLILARMPVQAVHMVAAGSLRAPSMPPSMPPGLQRVHVSNTAAGAFACQMLHIPHQQEGQQRQQMLSASIPGASAAADAYARQRLDGPTQRGRTRAPASMSAASWVPKAWSGKPTTLK